MKALSPSTALKLAAILALLNGASGLLMALPLIGRGAAQLDTIANSPPFFVVVIGFCTSILLIIGAYGTWKAQRWGIVLTLLLSASGALFAAPGIAFAPTTTLWWEANFGVLASVVTCILCLWRDRKEPAI